MIPAISRREFCTLLGGAALGASLSAPGSVRMRTVMRLRIGLAYDDTGVMRAAVEGARFGIAEARRSASLFGWELSGLECAIASLPEKLAQGAADAWLLAAGDASAPVITTASANASVPIYNVGGSNPLFRAPSLASLWHVAPSDLDLLGAALRGGGERRWTLVRDDSARARALEYLLRSQNFSLPVVSLAPGQPLHAALAGAGAAQDESSGLILAVAPDRRGSALDTAREGDRSPERMVVMPFDEEPSVNVSWPASWHSSLERFGGAQLNDRWRASHPSPMGSAEWQGWVGAKLVWETAQKAGAAGLGSAVGASRIDGHKGVLMRFDAARQLRQPLFLVQGGHTAVEVAP
ncbi:MAG: hypothetical protein JWO05_3311 [Gemmatimonadetes bacterium]|nr:hypothetical protein [Gemmatimonadota bacterium]